jgi:hypothetical protein
MHRSICEYTLGPRSIPSGCSTADHREYMRSMRSIPRVCIIYCSHILRHVLSHVLKLSSIWSIYEYTMVIVG